MVQFANGLWAAKKGDLVAKWCIEARPGEPGAFPIKPQDELRNFGFALQPSARLEMPGLLKPLDLRTDPLPPFPPFEECRWDWRTWVATYGNGKKFSECTEADLRQFYQFMVHDAYIAREHIKRLVIESEAMGKPIHNVVYLALFTPNLPLWAEGLNRFGDLTLDEFGELLNHPDRYPNQNFPSPKVLARSE